MNTDGCWSCQKFYNGRCFKNSDEGEWAYKVVDDCEILKNKLILKNKNKDDVYKNLNIHYI